MRWLKACHWSLTAECALLVDALPCLHYVRAQGADSLEVVHRPTPPGQTPPFRVGHRATAERGGIHAFGKCYIPFTSRGNKEVPQRALSLAV